MNGTQIIPSNNQKKLMAGCRPFTLVTIIARERVQEIEAMKPGATDFLEKPADLRIRTEKIRKTKAKKMILVEKKTEKKIKKLISTKGW